jgi:hypothetical protein
MKRSIVSASCTKNSDLQLGEFSFDAQGNVMSTYTHTTAADTLEGVPVTLATYAQKERHIYGSSRLGMDTRSVELIASFFVSPSADGTIHTTNADDRG